MAIQISGLHVELNPATGTAARIGLPVAILMAALAAVGFTMAILTPPHSGPWCTADCIAYPYADAARFFPRDYWWMIPGSLLAPLFAVIAACVHYCAPERSKPFSLLGVCLSTVAAVLIVLDYFMQIALAQPGLERHEFVAMFTQYNPHGMFIALEDIGYLALAGAFFLIALAIPPEAGVARGLRRTMSIAALLAALSFAGTLLRFGPEMALPFELAIITIDWFALLIGGLLFASFFRRAAAQSARTL